VLEDRQRAAPILAAAFDLAHQALLMSLLISGNLLSGYVDVVLSIVLRIVFDGGRRVAAQSALHRHAPARLVDGRFHIGHAPARLIVGRFQRTEARRGASRGHADAERDVRLVDAAISECGIESASRLRMLAYRQQS
jgi:hypothetical protein